MLRFMELLPSVPQLAPGQNGENGNFHGEYGFKAKAF
jgi:hypothetical protein